MKTIKFTKEHRHNGITYLKESQATFPAAIADWLVELGVAAEVKRDK